MNKAFGVQVTVAQDHVSEPKIAPVLVVAHDEMDAELLASEAAGPGASATVMRELTAEEVIEHQLDLSQHGSMKSLPILHL
ncbi:hypothetical protein [Methylobacterium frigidaeris]|uniref:Uncharacterized protein n=1 Tax=Methylobacterium frigidaeris TaxID=2038277 RepID=A0AA37HEQ1_9HYPH|nr:hypothetical protein [Methylobacterium frigidaeris]GJD64394.1 hypothetical protein MPEAHAMD_4575 [Methylobacterium frigidaeris]